MSYASRLPHWSRKHALWAVVGGAALASTYYVYYLYRYQGEHLVGAGGGVVCRLAPCHCFAGKFSRAHIRPLVSGFDRADMKMAVDAFLQFGYARHEELLPYPEGPQAALQFISSLGLLCERNCLALQDFTGQPVCCGMTTMLLVSFGQTVSPGPWSAPESSLAVPPGRALTQWSQAGAQTTSTPQLVAETREGASRDQDWP